MAGEETAGEETAGLMAGEETAGEANLAMEVKESEKSQLVHPQRQPQTQELNLIPVKQPKHQQLVTSYNDQWLTSF